MASKAKAHEASEAVSSTAGQPLSAEDVAEIQASNRLGIPIPERFAGVVYDNTRPQGAFYRYPTESETKAVADAQAAQAAAAQAQADLDARLLADYQADAGHANDLAAPEAPADMDPPAGGAKE